MIESLHQLDVALSVLINHFHSPILDEIMKLVSYRLTWIPLYLLALYLLWREYGWKGTILIALSATFLVLCTDQISVFMKDSFMRLRPCHQQQLRDVLHLADGCGGQYGFVSSHAANTMGIAFFLSALVKFRWFSVVMLFYALINSYSRVYLGKHFIGDVIGGMLLGLLCAWLIGYLLKRFGKKLLEP